MTPIFFETLVNLAVEKHIKTNGADNIAKSYEKYVSVKAGCSKFFGLLQILGC